MTFSAFFPKNLHNNASMINLGPLEMRLKKIKPTIDISTNPEVMAAILYGMGVNPATKINKYPYSTPLGAALSIHGFAFETTAEYIISPLALLIVKGTSLTLGVDM